MAVFGDVLDDHVDGDVGVCKRAEDSRRDALGVGHVADGELCFRGIVGNAGDQCFLHVGLVLLHEGARLVVERGAAVDSDSVLAGELDAALVQDTCAGSCHLEHLLVGDDVDLLGLGGNAGVGTVNAVDIGVDLANVGMDARGDGHGCGVRAASAERGDVAVGIDALEAGDDDDLVLLEGLLDALGVDLADLGLAVDVVGDKAHLAAAQADGLLTLAMDGHGHHRHRNELSSGEERVHLTGRGVGVDLVGERDEVVCGLAHRRNDGNHLVSGALALNQALCDAQNALGRSNAGSTELCDYK